MPIFIQTVWQTTCTFWFFIVLFSNVQSQWRKNNLSGLFVQAGEGQAEENGLQISSAFSLNPDTPPGRPTASFNPGRGSGPMGQLVQNGDTGTHNRAGNESVVQQEEILTKDCVLF